MGLGTSGAEDSHRMRRAAFAGKPASSTGDSVAPPFPFRFAGRRQLRTEESLPPNWQLHQPRPQCTTSRTKFGYYHAIPGIKKKC